MRSAARQYGRVFDRIAVDYDRGRPAYPDELVDRACSVAGLGRGDRVLEVGCGSGQLTRALLARGLRVTAVEPGEQLLALARRNVAGLGEVEYVGSRLEDCELAAGSFAAVFSASAFHWVDPEVSWQRVARLLGPGGTLALVQYCGLREPSSAHDLELLMAALARIAPEVAAGWPVYRDLDGIEAGVAARRENVSAVWAWIASQDVSCMDARRLFCDVQLACVPSVLSQTADELNAMVRTLSFYARLSIQQRLALEREHVIVSEQLGRPIRSGMVAVLVTARRRKNLRDLRI